MEPEPVFERSIEFKPIGYTFSIRARPSTIRGTVVRLLPWAVYAALPEGRLAKAVLAVAKRVSPMVRQKVR